jgi:hypothetical protein
MSLTKISHSMISGAWTNVLDKGAVMNDSSAGVRTANKAALIAAMATTNQVNIPAGVFWTDGNIELTENVTLVGAGTTLTSIMGDGDLFKVTTGYGVNTWQDFAISNDVTRGKLYQIDPGHSTNACNFERINFGKSTYHVYAPTNSIVSHRISMCRFNDASIWSRYYNALWNYTENTCYTWYCEYGLGVIGTASTCSIIGSVFEQNNSQAIVLSNTLTSEQSAWDISDTHFEVNGKSGTSDVLIETAGAGKVRTVTFNSCGFFTPHAATTPVRVSILAGGGGNISDVKFDGCSVIGTIPLCTDVAAAVTDNCYFQIAPAFLNTQTHVQVGTLNNHYLGTANIGGPVGGNLAVQATIAIPTDCRSVQIHVYGNVYILTPGANNAYLNAQVNVAAASVRTITDLDSTLGGANQGFIASWSAGSILVTNKNTLSNNQSGFIVAEFFS